MDERMWKVNRRLTPDVSGHYSAPSYYRTYYHVYCVFTTLKYKLTKKLVEIVIQESFFLFLFIFFV